MKKSAIIGISLLLSGITYAKDISLNEAINKALQNAFNIKAQKKTVKSKEFELKATKGFRYPKLTLYANFIRTNNPGYAMMNLLNQKRLTINNSANFVDMTSFNPIFGGFGVSFPSPNFPEVNNWQTKLQIELPIFTGFKLTTATKIREKDLLASKKELEGEKQKTVFNVIKAYKGALLAKEGIQIAQQAYNTARKHYEVAKKMYETGMAIYADVLRAKVYMLDMQNKITQAKSKYLTAKKALLLSMGETGISPEDIDVIGKLECKPPEKDVSYYQRLAVSLRPDLQAVRKKVLIAKDMIKMAKSDYYPSVGAFAFVENNSKDFLLTDDANWWGAGVGLTWNVFNGFVRENKYKSAKEMYFAYSQKLKGFEEYVKFQVYDSYYKWVDAYEKVKTKEEASKMAEEVLKITEKSYKNQMASMLDLIDTQTLRDKMKFDLSQAKYQCEIQNAQLLLNTGKLNK